MDWIEHSKPLFEIILILATVTSIIRGLIEYLKQSRIKQKDKFFKLRKELSENFFPILLNFEEFGQEVENLKQLKLEKNEFEKRIELITNRYDEELANIPYELRFKLLDHLEEISLMLNSGFIDINLTKYMYGWVIEQVWTRDGYWEYYNKSTNQKISRLSIKNTDWAIIKDLFLQMKELKNTDVYKRGNLKF